ncbi:DUF4307 domain-containing protein [Raineyella fluvialis]|uniref:DUF4307 domain-containing protein n=1 Tax=Raineyella fluvialis TaxID=2662261 RepID=A0A5Q2FIB3_9ACTN|nr:DUF4307 domain-containing protein [Raineyella fluvialis]QGF24096.1 DUF4307 domain-containing protein [Raineyella fluvialis]
MARTRIQALSDDPADIDRIARRYPGGAGRAAVLRLVLAVLIVVALGWYLQVALRNSQRPPVEATLTAHWVVDDQRAGFTLQVARTDPSRAAVCTVRAQAQNYEHIGDVDVPIPPSTQQVVTVDGTLRTVRRADAVYVEGCRLT